MSDTYYALTVVLEKDIGEEYGQRLINAIEMYKGVLRVTPNVTNIETYSTRQRVKWELAQKLREILMPD